MNLIHVQYSYIMRFLVRHNRHHKVSQSVPLFKSRKTVTIFLRIKVGGHFVMSIVKCHESHYVGVLDNPHEPDLTGVRADWSVSISKWWYVIDSFNCLRFRIIRKEPSFFGRMNMEEISCPVRGIAFLITPF